MSLARTAPPPAMFQQSLGARRLALTASLCAYTSRPPSRPRLLVPAVIAQSQTENRGILTKSPGDFSRTAPICLSGHAAQDAPGRILSSCHSNCRCGIVRLVVLPVVLDPSGIFRKNPTPYARGGRFGIHTIPPHQPCAAALRVCGRPRSRPRGAQRTDKRFDCGRCQTAPLHCRSTYL